MAAVNTGKVLTGGIVAGLIMNVSQYLFHEVAFAEEMRRMHDSMNLPMPGGLAIVCFILLGFIAAFVMMWLYAGLRAHHGAGPRTAILVALAVWFLLYAYATIAYDVIGMIPRGMTIKMLVWTLIEVPVAALAGAYLYRD